MTTTAAINIDILNQTATDVFTLNSVILNNVSFSNNQITFNNRSSGSLSINDLNLNLVQLQSFQTAIILNFPYLRNISNQSIGTANFYINRVGNTSCEYLFTANGGNNIDNFSYNFRTKLCTVTERTSPVTVNYACWLQSLINSQRFLQEINL